MKVLAILSDYLGCVPHFASSNTGFADWCRRSKTEIENGDFAQPEVDVIETYIDGNLRENSQVLHFVLTHEIVKKYDQEGLKLFRPVIQVQQEDTDVKEEKVEVVETFCFVDESLNEAKIQRDKELQDQLAKMFAEKFDMINEVLEKRNEGLISQLIVIQEGIDGPTKGRKSL
jgi:hypothetical protein